MGVCIHTLTCVGGVWQHRIAMCISMQTINDGSVCSLTNQNCIQLFVCLPCGLRQRPLYRRAECFRLAQHSAMIVQLTKWRYYLCILQPLCIYFIFQWTWVYITILLDTLILFLTYWRCSFTIRECSISFTVFQSSWSPPPSTKCCVPWHEYAKKHTNTCKLEISPWGYLNTEMSMLSHLFVFFIFFFHACFLIFEKCVLFLTPVCSKPAKKIIWLENLKTKPLCSKQQKLSISSCEQWNAFTCFWWFCFSLFFFLFFSFLFFPKTFRGWVWSPHWIVILTFVTVPSTSSACLWLGFPSMNM